MIISSVNIRWNHVMEPCGHIASNIYKHMTTKSFWKNLTFCINLMESLTQCNHEHDKCNLINEWNNFIDHTLNFFEMTQFLNLCRINRPSSILLVLPALGLEIHHIIQGICRGAPTPPPQLPWCPACFPSKCAIFVNSALFAFLSIVPIFEHKLMCPFNTEIRVLQYTLCYISHDGTLHQVHCDCTI
jgi:hypothetical protein